jgi:hypothetical protein
LAIKPADNETFFREVDEELRRDQLQGFWNRYGLLVVAAVVLLLAAVGGAIWWQNREIVQAGERGEQLAAVFEDVQAGRTKAAAPKLDALVAEGGPGYKAAALLTKADVAVQNNDLKGATATFRQIAADGELAEPYRQLALIRQTALEFDALPPADVIRRLEPLAKAGSPWFGSAGEMVALAHLKANRPRAAAPIFAALARDERLPPSIRSRAVQMAGALGVDAVSEPAGAAATKEATK